VCLTIPKKILSVKGNQAKINGGTVDVSVIKSPKKGDWVLVNANMAIQKIAESEAKEILKLIKQ